MLLILGDNVHLVGHLPQRSAPQMSATYGMMTTCALIRVIESYYLGLLV